MIRVPCNCLVEQCGQGPGWRKFACWCDVAWGKVLAVEIGESDWFLVLTSTTSRSAAPRRGWSLDVHGVEGPQGRALQAE
jgi:hypothetical protein